VPEATVLYEGLSFGESPRWHGGRLWVCDWGAEELLTIGRGGERELIAQVPSFPFCIDWLPDGRLLINAARLREVLTLDAGGELSTYADLRPVADPPPGNEIVTDGRGNAYVNGGGFDLGAGEPFAPGMIALVRPDRSAEPVAADLHFPNGMAITADGGTLIVAESYARRLTAFTLDDDARLTERRVWAELGEGVPDGICLDAEGAVWYADVPNRCCIRVEEGGGVLGRVELDRGAFSCALGGPDGATLFIVARVWHGAADFGAGAGSGQVLQVPAPVPAAPRPGRG
jgi:sugar lactone lactonase YvrE